MSYYDDPRIDDAVDRYFKLLRREGVDSPTQPNRHDCEVIGDIVYIRNVNGLLARFAIQGDGSMRRLVTTEADCERDAARTR